MSLPDSPLATVTSNSLDLKRPIGVMMAAVPQANTSVTSPDLMSSSRSVSLIIVSTTSMPRSCMSWIRERRVTPGRMLPVRDGVSTWPSLCTTIMFMPPSSSR